MICYKTSEYKDLCLWRFGKACMIEPVIDFCILSVVGFAVAIDGCRWAALQRRARYYVFIYAIAMNENQHIIIKLTYHYKQVMIPPTSSPLPSERACVW